MGTNYWEEEAIRKAILTEVKRIQSCLLRIWLISHPFFEKEVKIGYSWWLRGWNGIRANSIKKEYI